MNSHSCYWLLNNCFCSTVVSKHLLSVNYFSVLNVGIVKVYKNNSPCLLYVCHSPSFIALFHLNDLTCQRHICDSYPRLPDYRFVFRQLVRSSVHGSQDNWVLPIILMHCMWWGRGWFCLCLSCKIAKIYNHTTLVIMKMLRVLLHDNISSKHTKDRVCVKWKRQWKYLGIYMWSTNFHIKWIRKEYFKRP